MNERISHHPPSPSLLEFWQPVTNMAKILQHRKSKLINGLCCRISLQINYLEPGINIPMEIVVKFLVGLQSLLNQERSRTVTFVLISAYYSEDSMDFSSYYNVLANNHLWDTVFSLQVLEKVDYHNFAQIQPLIPLWGVFLSKWKVLVSQFCPTLWDPMDGSAPGLGSGSSFHGVLQARILEWVAIPFSRGSSRPRDRTWVLCTAGRFFNSWATIGH